MSGVFVVSKIALAREGLGQILDRHGIAVRQTLARLQDIDWPAGCATDIVLLGHPCVAEQISLLGQLLADNPYCRAIILTPSFDLETMIRCLRGGAFGYLVEDIPPASLIASINLVATGEKVLPSRLATMVQRASDLCPALGDGDPQLDGAELSQREFDVLSCLAAGYPNKLIARHLAISEATIKVHVKAILRKLKVMNRTQAAIWAAARGLPTQLTGDHPRRVN